MKLLEIADQLRDIAWGQAMFMGLSPVFKDNIEALRFAAELIEKIDKSEFLKEKLGLN